MIADTTLSPTSLDRRRHEEGEDHEEAAYESPVLFETSGHRECRGCRRSVGGASTSHRPSRRARAERPRDHGVCEKQDFIDCVRSREETLEPAEVGHRVTSMLLMGHISVRLDRKLTFDPVSDTFNDEEANEYL